MWRKCLFFAFQTCLENVCTSFFGHPLYNMRNSCSSQFLPIGKIIKKNRWLQYIDDYRYFFNGTIRGKSFNWVESHLICLIQMFLYNIIIIYFDMYFFFAWGWIDRVILLETWLLHNLKKNSNKNQFYTRIKCEAILFFSLFGSQKFNMWKYSQVKTLLFFIFFFFYRKGKDCYLENILSKKVNVRRWRNDKENIWSLQVVQRAFDWLSVSIFLKLIYPLCAN